MMTGAEFAACVARTSIAYFTMEVALGGEIRTYSGGLGVLAGDTVKSAADLDLPMVFVTLASRNGYIQQELDAGRQVYLPDTWAPGDWCTPLDAMVAVHLEGRAVWIRPWLFLATGRSGASIPVILLDSDVGQNAPADRLITASLYGGDARNRLMQEAILGIGGARMLHALGFDIRTFHLNEGHAALLPVELLRRMAHANPLRDGPERDVPRVREMCIFTTHTPVEAGHDRFDYGLVSSVLGDLVAIPQLKSWAGSNECNFTRLALALSGYVNGVAERHAETARGMFPGYSVHAITNGIHVPSWTYPAMARLFDAHAPGWRIEPDALVAADQIPDQQLLEAKDAARSDFVSFVERATGRRLDPTVPTIGFARRMTGYKRPLLLLSDLDRLRAISRQHRFQIVWSGKAHPADGEGKAIIRAIHEAMAALGDDVVSAYVPGYDIEVAKVLVAGADIWLNTPRPPLEASGTSGMKAAVNGTLNLSVLDGWWREAWIEDVTGWAIGSDAAGSDADHAASLHHKLETKILPLFSDRPRWAFMMKQSISKIGSRFNSQRMMRRYATDAYLR
jgi:starch phosphorylase